MLLTQSSWCCAPCYNCVFCWVLVQIGFQIVNYSDRVNYSAMAHYCYFCVMDVLFTPWLDEDDAKVTRTIAKNCKCEDTDEEPHAPLSPVTEPRLQKPLPKKTAKQNSK